jgi:hypothetical protein
MTATEIRRRTATLLTQATSTHKCELAAVELLGEIAAQLADLNARIGSPPDVYISESKITVHKDPADCPSVRCGLWKECQGHSA